MIQLSIPATIWHTHPQPVKTTLGNYKVRFDPSLMSNIPKRFICLQQLCRKFFDKFVPLTNREYTANEATLLTASFKPTDKVDGYIVINTGASAGIRNANEDYGAHQDIVNGPMVEFADGSSKQVTYLNQYTSDHIITT